MKIERIEKEKVVNIITDRIILWGSHGTDAPLASPYSHLTLVGELYLILKEVKGLTHDTHRS